MESEQIKAAESANTQKLENPNRVKIMSVDDISQGEPPDASSHVIRDVYQKEPERGAPKLEAPSGSASIPSKVDLSTYRDKSGQKFRTWKGHYLDETGKPAETKGGYLKVDKAKVKKVGLLQRAKESVDEIFHRKKEPESSGLVEPELDASPGTSETEPNQSFRMGSFFRAFENKTPDETAGGTDEKESYRIAAQETVAIEETLAMMLFSEEWQFLDRERQGLINVWARHYERTGFTEVPLWVQMVSAHMVIVTTRMNKPKTSQRFSSLKKWFLKKWIDLRSPRNRPVEITEKGKTDEA